MSHDRTLSTLNKGIEAGLHNTMRVTPVTLRLFTAEGAVVSGIDNVIFIESSVRLDDVAIIVAVPSDVPDLYIIVAIPLDAITGLVPSNVPPAVPLKANVIIAVELVTVRLLLSHTCTVIVEVFIPSGLTVSGLADNISFDAVVPVPGGASIADTRFSI